MLIDWKKIQRYWRLRLIKLKGSPKSVAIGVACGAAVSFTPFVGAHLILAMILAWCFRGNIAAAALGTAVGNPWTFPFIWFAVLYMGCRILGIDSSGIEYIEFSEIFSKSFKALINFDFDLFFSDIWPILHPMIVGCVPFFIIVWIVVYYGIDVMLSRSEG